MTQEERQELKEKIKEQIAKLEKKIADLKLLTAPIAPDDSIGRISRMDAINNKSVNDAALRTSETKLQKLNDALKNVNNPDFGLCVICRQSIPAGRILLMPESTRCVKCASR